MAVTAAPTVGARALPAWREAAPKVVLGLAVLLTLALRLPFLNEPLGVDEGGLAYIAHFWNGTAGHSLYGNYWVDRPPLLLALFKLAGLDGAVGIRLLGAAAAIGLVVLAYALGRSVAGPVAAATAALLAAATASAAALLAIFTPSELLASVPAAASILCLVGSREHGARRLVAAGALAATALLIKQSFMDAGAAGAVFLVASAVTDRRRALHRLGAYAAGVLIPLAALAIWLALAHEPVHRIVYALFGFRISGLQVLASAHRPITARAAGLFTPAKQSGELIAAALALIGLWRLRHDRVLVATLAAWLLAGLVGILGGGSYWPHYLIQIVVPTAVLAAAGLAGARLRYTWPAVAAVVLIAVFFNVKRVQALTDGQNRHGITAIAHYIDSHARPGDTQYVLYAKANVDYYTGLPSPYPYAWSLMVRALPGAPARLARLLHSPQRPTWVVGWNRVGQWHLPHAAQIAGALKHDYRPAKRVGSRVIYRAI